MQEEYAPDSRNRSLQLEALAHTAVHEQLPTLLAADTNSSTEGFWRAVHQAFYAQLTAEFLWVETQEGTQLELLPSELRTTQIRVGRHVAPAAEALSAFIERMEGAYRPQAEANRLARIVTIAATHHRLA